MNKINLMIIGIGNHAQRIFVPMLNKYSESLPIQLKVGIELNERENVVNEFLSNKKIFLNVVYLDKFDPQSILPEDIERKLDVLVKENDIQGVIIATEPLVHKIYATWALSRGLHILMDKPISTRQNVTSDMKQAIGIIDDYQELRERYVDLQLKKETIFSINVQRRYEVGYHKTFELIKEVAYRFNAPITSIQAMHSDGVWIFPDEIVDQICHPYFQGYGNCSHSGYHIFDIIWQIYKAGKIKDKFPDSGEVMSSFIQPTGLLTQFNLFDYSKYFGKQFDTLKKRSEEELRKMYKDYGENDAFSILRLLKNGDNICNISINLSHNSFSRRSWPIPGKDLYKGNGRVKHQSYYIQQGPFQCIQIHNYQSSDAHETNTIEDYKLGGNNHFDIYVFRNSKMFGDKEIPLRVINLKDLDINKTFDDNKIYQESAKEKVILEFIYFMLGRVRKEDLKSNITTHTTPIKIMSSIYQSHIQQMNGGSAIAKFKIDANEYIKTN